MPYAVLLEAETVMVLQQLSLMWVENQTGKHDLDIALCDVNEVF